MTSPGERTQAATPLPQQASNNDPTLTAGVKRKLQYSNMLEEF
jgi:hypothetical protein